MKSYSIITAGGMAFLLAGCASFQKGIVLEGVGPDPASVVNIGAVHGNLLVYSAYEIDADFSSRDPRRPEYSDYRILAGDGKPVEQVHNNSGTILQRPKEVELPAGAYQVEARANGYGIVTVPVTIAPGQITMVHLQGGVAWPDHPAFDESNSVRLPDGEIVGWKSAVAMK
jgi:hypothetical protein